MSRPSPTTARLSTPRLSPLPTLLPLSMPLPALWSTLPPLSMPLPALWSTPLLLSMPPSTLPPFTAEPVRCRTSPCQSLTRERTGRPPSPRPSEPPSPPSTTHPALSTELTAGGDLPTLDTELSLVKKLKQPIIADDHDTEDIRRLNRLFDAPKQIDTYKIYDEVLSCDIHQVIYLNNLFCGKYTLLLRKK